MDYEYTGLLRMEVERARLPWLRKMVGRDNLRVEYLEDDMVAVYLKWNEANAFAEVQKVWALDNSGKA